MQVEAGELIEEFPQHKCWQRRPLYASMLDIFLMILWSSADPVRFLFWDQLL